MHVVCRRVEQEGALVRTDKNGVEYYLYTTAGARGGSTQLRPPAEKWREKAASASQRDRAYRALVAALPLSPGHLESLRKRGLPGEWLESCGYSTLPDDERREAAVDAVQATSLSYLLQVPGFFKRDGSKTPRLGGSQGILIPVRDVDGMIVACSIRVDEPGDSGKYRWLSAPPGTIGCGPGAVLHVPLHEGLHETVRITEGAIKADVATALSGVLSLGLPGVSAWRLTMPALRALGAKRVLLAFDADARRNPHVARSLARIACHLAAGRYAVAIEVWPDSAGKGIDDVLAGGNGHALQTHEGKEAWERIAEIHAEAGAGNAPQVQARTELDGLLDRIKQDTALAFSPETLEAAAQLEEGTPEFERLRDKLKSCKIRIAVWCKRVTEARQERKQRELKRTPQDAWMSALVNNDDGSPQRGLANTLAVLTTHPAWLGKLAYDAFAEVPVSVGLLPVRADDDPGNRTSGDLTEADLARSIAWFASVIGFEPAAEHISQAIAAAAQKRVIHPIRDYLHGLAWDGTARLDAMLTRWFGAADSEYARAVGSKWMLSAVARVMEPGCQCDCVLVLEGEQGRGKSTALKALFGEAWFSDTGINIGEKDSYQALRRKWCHEFGELDAFRGRDATRVKNFISSSSDTYRPSFGRVSRDFPRQIVFAGSTNESQYLVDRTGNRRFWPVKCEGSIDVAGIAQARDQLWAEARVRYQRGERWHVDTAELRGLCEAEQKARETVDAWTDVIAKWLQEPTVPDRSKYGEHQVMRTLNPADGISTTDVLLGALGFAPDRMKHADTIRAGTILTRDLGWHSQRRRVEGGRRVWKYFPPVAPPSQSVGAEDWDTDPAENVSDSALSQCPSQISICTCKGQHIESCSEYCSAAGEEVGGGLNPDRDTRPEAGPEAGRDAGKVIPLKVWRGRC